MKFSNALLLALAGASAAAATNVTDDAVNNGPMCRCAGECQLDGGKLQTFRSVPLALQDVSKDLPKDVKSWTSYPVVLYQFNETAKSPPVQVEARVVNRGDGKWLTEQVRFGTWEFDVGNCKTAGQSAHYNKVLPRGGSVSLQLECVKGASKTFELKATLVRATGEAVRGDFAKLTKGAIGLCEFAPKDPMAKADHARCSCFATCSAGGGVPAKAYSGETVAVAPIKPKATATINLVSDKDIVVQASMNADNYIGLVTV